MLDQTYIFLVIFRRRYCETGETGPSECFTCKQFARFLNPDFFSPLSNAFPDTNARPEDL